MVRELITKIFLMSLLLSIGCGGGSSDKSYLDRNTDTYKTMTAHWNHVSVDASGFDHSIAGARENMGPTRSSRAMAIVHIAMFDAANAASGLKYEPFYLNDIVVNASVEAAIAQASRDTLIALFPSQQNVFEQHYQNDLKNIPDGIEKERGLTLGARAAALSLSERANDGSGDLDQNVPYVFSQEPGAWRRDPVNPTQQALGANWYKVRPFVLKSATQFRSEPPPALDSIKYAEEYAEVYRLGGDGISTPTERTEDQTFAGLFWAYDGTPSLCAPPRLYNQIALQIASDRGITDDLELTRLLALVNVSMADAGITSWETKYYYNLWRPITAIREADQGTGPTGKGDGNPNTFGDPNWTPLGAPASNLIDNNFTPPFPAYVSGHATFGGALFQTLRNYFGTDNIPFTFVSDELNGVTTDNNGNIRPLRPRSFSSLSEAEFENGMSRIYLGIHFRSDATEGTKMGNQVANYVFQNKFRARRAKQ